MLQLHLHRVQAIDKKLLWARREVQLQHQLGVWGIQSDA